MSLSSSRHRKTALFPPVRKDATSCLHFSASAHDRYNGNASARRYEGTNVAAISFVVKVPCVALALSDEYRGGSNAENAGVKELTVHALSGVGSCCMVRESYAYANKSVSSVRYRLCV